MTTSYKAFEGYLPDTSDGRHRSIVCKCGLLCDTGYRYCYDCRYEFKLMKMVVKGVVCLHCNRRKDIREYIREIRDTEIISKFCRKCRDNEKKRH